MPFFQISHPRVFAHRGGCALGPENTIAAFDLGLAAGADGLELDVRLSADGVPVVCHDATLDRTTNRTGRVDALNAAQLAGVDAGWGFATAAGEHPFRNRGVGMPTLREVLARYRDAPIIVEMKVNSVEMGHAVAAEVRAAGAVERVCAAGFGLQSLQAVRAALPDVATSACHVEVRVALYRSWVRWPFRRARYGGYQVPEHAGGVRVVSPRFVRDAHRANLRVDVWTVDEEADMQRFLEWGVDGLISNQPGLAVRVRDQFMGRSGHVSDARAHLR